MGLWSKKAGFSIIIQLSMAQILLGRATMSLQQTIDDTPSRTFEHKAARWAVDCVFRNES